MPQVTRPPDLDANWLPVFAAAGARPPDLDEELTPVGVASARPPDLDENLTPVTLRVAQRPRAPQVDRQFTSNVTVTGPADTFPPRLSARGSEVTALAPDEEAQFQAWAKENRIENYDHPDAHYDMRGFWKATGGAAHPPGSEQHFPDTFKQHGHPTFSVESQYSKGPQDGGHWNGDTFVPPTPQPVVRLGSAKTGGGATATPNFMDVPTEGVKQIARGAGALVSHPAVLPTEPHVIAASAPGKDEATYNALADLLEGAGKAATPLAVAGAIVNLPGTAATLAASWLASKAADRAAAYEQATPSQRRFFSALAGTVVAAGGAKKVLDGLSLVTEATATAATAAARPLVLAGKLSGYGTGDVPGFRAAPYVAESTIRPGVGPLEGTPEFEALQQRTRAAAGLEATAPRGPNVEQPVEQAPRPNMTSAEAQAAAEGITVGERPARFQPIAMHGRPPDLNENLEPVAAGKPVGVPDNPLALQLEAERRVIEDADQAARAGAQTSDAPAQPAATAPPPDLTEDLQPETGSFDVEPPKRGPEPQTFEQFSAAYQDAFREMNKYTPNEVGSRVFSDRMADLADGHPDWAQMVENGETPETSRPSAGTTRIGASDVGQPPASSSAGTAPETGARDVSGRAGPQHDRSAQRRGLASEERAARRRARKAARDASRAEAAQYERDDLEALVAEAKQRGFAGDHTALRADLESTLQDFRELDAEWNQSGQNGLALLRAIAKGGGISGRAESGQKGEIAWLKEFADMKPSASRRNLKAPSVRISGQIRGVAGVFHDARGLSLDGMVEYLRQDPRFQHIERINDLTDAIRRAATGVDDTSDAMARVRSYLHNELDQRGHAPLAKPIEDANEYGEAQPRLPGVADARQVRSTDVSFRAPQQASGGDFSLDAQLTAEQQAAEAESREGPRLFGDDVDAPAASEIAHEMRASSDSESEHDIQVPRVARVAAATVQAATANLKSAHADIRATLTAPNVSRPAQLSSRYLRFRVGQMMHTLAYANRALKPYRDMVEKATVDHAEILDLADAIEDPRSGKILPDWLKPWVPLRNEIFDYLKKQIAELGIDKEWRAYYLGHVWETEFKDGTPLPHIVRALLIGRRPLQGPKSFLKRRTIPTMRQGVERFNKEPKTWNLVEIDLYKMQEMAKFILGRQALEDNKALGTWVFQTALKKAPDGMLPIPDPIGQVWAPPEVTVAEAYDKLLMEGLESFIHGLGVQYTRKPGSGDKWGSSGSKTGNITARFGGPEGVLMHEIGHTLDLQYGLYDRIATTLKTPEFAGDTSALKELRALAALRYQGQTPGDKFKRYVQTHAEQIANLVHAYLYAPELARKAAPRAYDALDELVLTEPALAPLADLQQMRSLVLGTREATQKLAGPILLGRYYASPDVVRIFKNYLTPGLSANKLWTLVRIPANAMVQAKLAFSAFHAFTITQESAAMEAARGLTDVLRGKPSGVARLGKALAEPVNVLRRGRKVKQEYLGTLDPLTLAVDSATNLLIAGGGRVEQSREYTNRSIGKFMDHLRRANGAFVRSQRGRAGSELLGAALHFLPALVEASAYPVMQMLVPAAKVGATTEQIRAEIERLPGRPTEKTLLAIASKAVNLADATLGEVIWDNYFLPRALMSAVHMVIMAPGWRGGSAIILGRGLTDPVRRLFPGQRETYQVRVPAPAVAGSSGSGKPTPPGAPKQAAPTDQETERLVDVKERYWSPYTSLMIATVLIQVLVSEIFQRAHGAGHVETMRDVAFPRTGKILPDGKPERVRIPGYAGIFYDILRDVPSSVLEYALGGTAPMPTMIGQLYHNETMFGTEIVDHSDPWRSQLADYAKFLEEQFEPISLSSYGRRADTPAEKAESLMGISPAPARVTRTALDEYLHGLAPTIHRTQDEAEKAQARRDLQSAARAHNPAAARAAIQAGGLSGRSVAMTLQGLGVTGTQRAYEHTTPSQALKGFEIATPEERAEIYPAFIKKAGLLMDDITAARRAETVARIAAALRLRVTPMAQSR